MPAVFMPFVFEGERDTYLGIRDPIYTIQVDLTTECGYTCCLQFQQCL